MQVDADLLSIQEVQNLVARAKEAGRILAAFDQGQVDRLVGRMAEAGRDHALRLAEQAVAETGLGVVADKATKNTFATERVYEFVKGLRTVGVIREDRAAGLLEIAEPVGIVAGITPSTNPTSTVMYKSLIALKARNPIVFCPHPAAARCSGEAAGLMAEAVVAAGGPEGAVGCISVPTLGASHELMHHPDVAVILATGGTNMVKAAYSSGKPAFGVGPGNVPAYVERSADVGKAVRDIVASKTFDHGTICASEQAVITEPPLKEAVVRELELNGAYFLAPGDVARVSRAVVRADGSINPQIVGQPAGFIARLAAVQVPEGTRLLVAPLAGVGREYPLSKEKLSPVLAFYVEEDWHRACERCIELLNFGGLGHTMVIHSRNPEVVMEFALKKPVFRILVNTPASFGAIGYTTGLAPALTLGCGTWGGSSTSDNVTPLHLLNLKRLAYEVRPVAPVTPAAPAGVGLAPSGAAPAWSREELEQVVRRCVTRVMAEAAAR